MVDDMKRQMRRFDHLIGFEGKMRVTSRDTTQGLIHALDSKYKSDVQNNLRLHCLQFFHDLVQSSRRGKTEEGRPSRRKEDGFEDAVSITAEDIDDWKERMTLSKIYYVLEHPRFPGLTWKRRIFKKKKMSNFGDRDLIEWKVAQNFRLRGLEEWMQSRKNARKMADQIGYDISEEEKDSDLEKLFEMFDPSEKAFGVTQTSTLPDKGTKTRKEKEFNFKDESMTDWVESYSEDSEHSAMEDFVEEVDDLSDETEQKMGEFHVTRKPSFNEERNISEILSNYKEFEPYRDPVFHKMDEAKSIQDWFDIYNKMSTNKSKEKIKKCKLDISKMPTLVESEEESNKEELGTEDLLAKRIDEEGQWNRDDADEILETKEESLERSSHETSESEFQSDGEGAKNEDPIEQVVKQLLQDMKERVSNDVDEDTTEHEVNALQELDI